MKIAITAGKLDLNCPVETRFGRAPGFIIHDTKTGDDCFIENTQNIQAAQGAGIQAAQTVLEQGAEAVITGNCGPKAFRVFETAGTAVYLNVNCSVNEAITQLKDGQLQLADIANVEGHWG